MTTRRWWWIGIVAVALGAWLLRPGRRSEPQRAARMEYAPVRRALTFPDKVETAPQTARELYEFAARRPDVLHYVPCFCGCWRAGHRSSYDCFIDQVHPDGRVDVDGMGFT